MADIVDELRKAAWTSSGPIMSATPTMDLAAKSAIEIEKLRKEVKLLKAANARLVTSNLILMLLLAGIACGGFMASLLYH